MDPLSNIEDKKGMQDLGVMVIRIFQGALSETDNIMHAFLATAAYFYAMFKNGQDTENDS